MNTYAILRRDREWTSPDDVAQAAERSTRVGREEMPDQIRWVRSYVVETPDKRLGTICIYRASDEQAVREHARRAKIPADEVLPVRDVVIVEQESTH